MNPSTDDHDLPFANPAHEREWLAQERALQRESRQPVSADEDMRSHSYRLLAQVLREPLDDTLPADFARCVAARVVAMPTQPLARESRFESALTFALGLVLMVAAGIVMTIYGSTWLPAFHAVLPAPQVPSNGWLLTLAGCLGASWLLAQWPARRLR